MKSLLETIDGVGDLKALDSGDLPRLAEEVRSLIIDTVSRTGGHLAANLGVVELTIAILRVFSPPSDRIIWDVSHQTYAYKALTGRKTRFHTLRQFDGISGFARRQESEYDAFGAGHSGTALSAALGIAVARDRRGGNNHVVAVVGDGSAGCGVSLEALNNVSGTTRRLIVILNDNEMSISANVGAISRYLGGLLASPRYNRWKRAVEGVATRIRMGWLRSAYYRLEEALKGLFLRSIIFEEFGLRYIGPIDGHDLKSLEDAMEIARNSDRPIVVHVSTQKGRGYALAEKHPEKWHGTSAFDVNTGEPSVQSGKPDYSGVFGRTMIRIAERNDRIMAITAAMPAGTGLKEFAGRFPGRFFDVGMSEEHAVVFAAGLASEGFVPVFAVYSTFAQRAVDYIIHDVCLQDLGVVICLDRAGIVGDDGPTHHGVFDIALLRSVPGITIMQPVDETELCHMLYTATEMGRPVVIRYPRGSGPGSAEPAELRRLEIGKADVVMQCPADSGRGRVWIWALGDMVQPALQTAGLLSRAGVNAGVVNARFVCPPDEGLLREHAETGDMIVTMENGVVAGGFGSAVEERLAALGYGGGIRLFGWPNEFIPQGSPCLLMERFGLTPETMSNEIGRALRERNSCRQG